MFSESTSSKKNNNFCGNSQQFWYKFLREKNTAEKFFTENEILRISQIFSNHKIDDSLKHKIGEDHLREMGISEIGSRQKILQYFHCEKFTQNKKTQLEQKLQNHNKNTKLQEGQSAQKKYNENDTFFFVLWVLLLMAFFVLFQKK